tara:strand:+ start:1889 stop:2230 length:342 start_codon:yes stop_codon:yes gene_type:complete
MQYYPQHYYGFIVDNSVAELLDLSEAYDAYEMAYDEEQFFDQFENKFGVSPYQFTDTTYERGGYVQGLQGFDWDSTYVCFHPATAGDEKWNNMISKLQKLGIPMEEGRWSQLG